MDAVPPQRRSWQQFSNGDGIGWHRMAPDGVGWRRMASNGVGYITPFCFIIARHMLHYYQRQRACMMTSDRCRMLHVVCRATWVSSARVRSTVVQLYKLCSEWGVLCIVRRIFGRNKYTPLHPVVHTCNPYCISLVAARTPTGFCSHRSVACNVQHVQRPQDPQRRSIRSIRPDASGTSPYVQCCTVL